MTAVKPIDLTPLFKDRVHLKGYDCAALRALRTLQALLHPPNKARVEFWEHNTTNPSDVKCVDCWKENPQVRATFTPYVVIKLSDRAKAHRQLDREIKVSDRLRAEARRS